MLLAPLPALAQWTADALSLEGAYELVAAMDWAQTRTVAENPQSWHEYNSILGRHPSVAAVDNFFLAGAVLHPVVTAALPDAYRRWWQIGTLSIESAIVGRNRFIGLRMSF